MALFKRLTGAAFMLLVLAPTYGACTATVGVSEFYSALDGEGLRRRNEFFSDTKEIHCVARFAAGRNDYTLSTQLRRIQNADGTPADVVGQVLELADGPREDGVFDTKFTPVDENGEPDENLPYPVGAFRCELSVDGKLERTAVFNVRPSPCPDEFITGQTLCMRYSEGLKCANGTYGGQPHSCTCTRTGNGVDLAWVCD